MRIKGIYEGEVKRFIEDRYRLNIKKITYFPIGEDGATYKIMAHQGKYFCKVYNKMPKAYISIRRIKIVMNFLYDINNKWGISGVPLPLKNTHNNVISLHKGFPVVLYEHIYGKNLGSSSMTNSDFKYIANIIVKIHNLNLKNFPNIKGENLSLKYEGKIIRIIKELEKVSSKNKLKKLVLSNKEYYVSGINFAKKEAHKVIRKSKLRVIVHSDYHSGNIMKGKNGIFLIDWDGLQVAQPEKDLMWFGKDFIIKKSFLEEYKKLRKRFNLDKGVLKFYIIRRLISDIVFACRRLMLNNNLDKGEINKYYNQIKDESLILKRFLKRD